MEKNILFARTELIGMLQLTSTYLLLYGTLDRLTHWCRFQFFFILTE